MGVMSSSMKQSFFLPKPHLTEKNLPDQHGRVFIVTGSNTGVGYQLAKILYGANGTVYVAARTESKANAAIDSIKSAHTSSKGSIHFLQLDLSDLTTIQASANEFLSKESRLDVLINNAGVMIPPPNSKSAQGHELQYGTNVLGPFLFTKLLLPILKETAQTQPKGSVRVSWAGSLGIDVGSPAGGLTLNEDGSVYDFKTGGQSAYATSKAANFFLGYEFGQRQAADGVLHNSFNPGNLASDLQRHARESMSDTVVDIMSYLVCFAPIYGAYTELYAGWSPDLTIEADQGGYIWPWGRRGPPRKDVLAECKTGGKSEKLFEWCERETGKFVRA